MQRVGKSGQCGPASEKNMYTNTQLVQADMIAEHPSGSLTGNLYSVPIFFMNPHCFLHLLHNRPHVPECMAIESRKQFQKYYILYYIWASYIVIWYILII